MRELYGVDPDEVVQCDYEKWTLTRLLENAKAKAASAKDGESDAAAKAVLDAQANLEAYQGGGPIFSVRWIEGAKWAELSGMVAEMEGIPRPSAAYAQKDFEWAREVVRWGLTGHQGLKRRNGAEDAFAADTITFLGSPRSVVSAKTLESYYLSRALPGLAAMVWSHQALGEDLKNV